MEFDPRNPDYWFNRVHVQGAGKSTRTGDWVNTASYDSVVAPVHQRAIARWKHFEPFLGPMLAPLTPYVDRMGDQGHTK
ncbi:MAG: hypothetical protein O3B37_10885 [Proteobacteria bacterium]|nr:hypothetical protein [Pseudomonadota bacterium]